MRMDLWRKGGDEEHNPEGMGEFSRKPLLVTKPTDIRHKAKIG
jgi:hypothetical protein